MNSKIKNEMILFADGEIDNLRGWLNEYEESIINEDIMSESGDNDAKMDDIYVMLKSLFSFDIDYIRLFILYNLSQWRKREIADAFNYTYGELLKINRRIKKDIMEICG